MKIIKTIIVLVLFLIIHNIFAQSATLDHPFKQNRWMLDPILTNINKAPYNFSKARFDCEPISTFPWAEGFEENGTKLPLCWELERFLWQWEIVQLNLMIFKF